MLFWTLSFLFFGMSLTYLWKDASGLVFGIFLASSGPGARKGQLARVASTLRELEETLMVGLVPSLDRWDRLKDLAHPWGVLSSTCLKSLRDAGGSLLPTLKRLRGLAESHLSALEEAQAKSSQALAQSLACSLLVPILGVSLYLLLPGIELNALSWWGACGGALVLAGIGALWLFQLTDAARWGGLARSHRGWALSAECAGERFLALVRAGVPPDLSWTQALEVLVLEARDLSLAWGSSVWEEPGSVEKGRAEQIIISAGLSIKKAVQVSLLEGRPCTDRVETALLALRQNLRAQVERELSLLGTRALKPLFFCVAPALLGLLAYGLWIAAGESIGVGLEVF
jgi:hypothetical protein